MLKNATKHTRKLLATITQLTYKISGSVDYDEYMKAHPASKKKRNDPMFKQPQQAPAQQAPAQQAPAQQAPAQQAPAQQAPAQQAPAQQDHESRSFDYEEKANNPKNSKKDQDYFELLRDYHKHQHQAQTKGKDELGWGEQDFETYIKGYGFGSKDDAKLRKEFLERAQKEDPTLFIKKPSDKPSGKPEHPRHKPKNKNDVLEHATFGYSAFDEAYNAKKDKFHIDSLEYIKKERAKLLTEDDFRKMEAEGVSEEEMDRLNKENDALDERLRFEEEDHLNALIYSAGTSQDFELMDKVRDFEDWDGSKPFAKYKDKELQGEAQVRERDARKIKDPKRIAWLTNWSR